MMDRSKQVAWRWSAVCMMGLALLALAGCSDRRSEQHRGEGDTLFKLGRIDEARQAYLKAEETNADNPMAQLGLARCAAADGDTETALACYEKARQRDPNLEEAYMEPVRLLLEAGMIDEALGAAESYASVVPEKGGLLYSAVLLKAQRTQEATARLEALREQFPASPEVLLNLAVAYSEGGKLDAATAILKDLAHGASQVAPAAQMALIEVYQKAGKTEELLAEFEQLAAAQPENVNVQLGYARGLLMAGRLDDAEAIARRVLDAEPKSGWANYIVGALKLQQGSQEEAVAFLESAAAALPEEKEVGDLLLAAKSGKTQVDPTPDAATRTADSTAKPQTWQDLWQQAALKRLLDNRDSYLASGDMFTRETLALAALFMHNAPLAREIQAGLPEDSHIGLYFKAMESKDSKQIAAFFEGWKPEEPEYLLLRDNALGFAMAAGGSRGQALSVFLFCLERWPDNVVALFNIAQVFRSIGQPIVAAQQLQRLIVQYPENIDAHQMLYSSLREGAAFDQARKAAEASFALFPEEQWSFMNLSQSYLDTGDYSLAMQVLNRGNSLFPGDPELRLATGGVLVRLGDCDQATTVLNDLVTSAPRVIANRSTLLALCAAQHADWPAVVSAAAPVERALWPDTLSLLASVAYLEGGDEGAAQGALLSGDSQTPVAGNLGRMLSVALGKSDTLGAEEEAWAATLAADHGLLRDYTVLAALQGARLHDAAWTYYKEHLASRQPPHIGVAQLAFAALALCGNVEDPKAEGTAIANALGDDARAWLGLGEMLRQRGDEAGQAEAIGRAIEVGKDNPEAWFRHAVLQEKQGDFDGAVTSYRRLLEIQPESAAANNNLAYMLLQAGGKDEEALALAKVAQEKMPTNPGVLHTLGLAQMRTEDLEGARSSLTMATEIDPANPTITFDYGRLLLKLGDKAEAKKRIRYALGMNERAGVEFPELDEAKGLLDTLD